MRRVAILVGALTLLPAPVGAAITKPPPRDGIYFSMHGLPREWRSPDRLVGGVPMHQYSWGPERNPVTAAQYGLAVYSLWIAYRDPGRLKQAVRVADWLVRTQKRNGKWLYHFPVHPIGSNQMLPVGWSSGLAQGQAISLLERVYHQHSRARYRRAIHRALRPLERTVEHGGLARHWDGKNLYFEEYPTAEPNFVLNGDAQTLIGLYEAEPLDPVARRLFKAGAAGLANTLHLFDSHQGRSYYCAASKTLAPENYSRLIRQILRALAPMTGRQIFARYAGIWNG
jgi:heparosan-N-sulfate-glucuronate 5-epimerase